MLASIQIVAGLVTLIVGGELLVRGASAIATAMRIPPLIIGLTVVAFGTSAPELGVSLQAAYAGSVDVAVGNVIGSNVFNVLFVLGLSALFSPLIVSSQLIRFDVPLMIGASILTWWLARDGGLSRLDGVWLFGLLVLYLVMCFANGRRKSPTAAAPGIPTAELVEQAESDAPRRLPLQFVLMVAGLVGLTFGAKWLVDGAVSVATWLGVSQLIIGLTIVAIGTSLPEIVTSVVATLRGERDIAVGNVVGSNLFNLGCVLGISSIVAPNGIPVGPEAVAFDLPVMIAVAAICFPIFFTGQIIARWEGALFLVYYVAYTTLLIVSQTHPSLAEQYRWVLGFIVLPATLLTIAGSFLMSLRKPAM